MYKPVKVGSIPTPPSKNKEMIKKTCLNVNCPERLSICCKALSRSASEPEILLGVPAYFCSKCGKEFKGGKCSKKSEKIPLKICPKCKKKTFIVSIFGSICSNEKCFYKE